MGAAGDRLQREPGEAVAAAAYFPVCHGFLTVRVRLLPPAAFDIQSSQRHVDGAFVLGRSAFDHGPIGLSDLAVLEQQAERGGGPARASQHETAPGILGPAAGPDPPAPPRATPARPPSPPDGPPPGA